METRTPGGTILREHPFDRLFVLRGRCGEGILELELRVQQFRVLLDGVESGYPALARFPSRGDHASDVRRLRDEPGKSLVEEGGSKVATRHDWTRAHSLIPVLHETPQRL